MHQTFRIVLAAIVFGTVLPATALAQQSSAPIPELRLEGMPADITACVRSCVSGTTSDSSCRPTGTADAERRLTAIDGQLASARRSIRDHERRITALEGEVGLLRGRVTDLEGRIAEQQRQIEALLVTVRALHRYYLLVIEDYVDLAVRVGINETKITDLQRDVAALETRVSRLESRTGTVQLGARVGGLVLHAFDGTTYSGFALGPRFTLRLTDSMTASVDAQMLLSVSDNPFGTRIRGGWQWEFVPTWELDAGLSASWVGYDNRLNAKSAFLGPDVGVTWRPLNWLNVGANFFVGAEFDQGNPAPAIGGMLTLGFDLPGF